MQSLIDVKALEGTLAGDIATELFACRQAHRKAIGESIERLLQVQKLQAENARLKAACAAAVAAQADIFRELVSLQNKR